jgi:hypothetical protein
MLKRYAAALTALSLLAGTAAHADYVIKDGAGASQTFGSFSLSGVQFPKRVMVDPTTGAAIGVSGNPMSVSIVNFPATQGIAGSVSLSTGTNAIGSVLSDLRVGGAAVATGNPVPVLQAGAVTLAPNGLGALTAVPAGSTNGTALGTPPTGKRGARLYVPPGASISFGIAAAQPGSAPTTITVANPSTNTVPANWDEDLAGTQMIYVTALTGTPLFRWY